MHDNKAFWQKFAGLYGPFMKSSGKLYREICGHIAPHLHSQMTVLELACGTGQLSFPLHSGVKLWEATDFSEAMIAHAKKKGISDKLLFSVQDATDLPYADSSFDAVLIANALHIMPCPEKALSEIRRVLRRDGILFAPTFVHGEGTAFRLRVWFLERLGFHTYYKWTEPEFVSFLERGGFTVTAHTMLGKSIAPLCFSMAVRKE